MNNKPYQLFMVFSQSQVLIDEFETLAQALQAKNEISQKQKAGNVFFDNDFTLSIIKSEVVE
ncbi:MULTISPECIES: hypothetical protein [unclassified Lonepinella]|uniref:hypothetical protein n=1 Tax=unclassified Lonepinella TaxID=2642006 RepID=UPI0036DA0FC2